MVHQWGLDIVVKSYFDGGWGYHITDQARELPMPEGCYTKLAEDVFWHDPC